MRMIKFLVVLIFTGGVLAPATAHAADDVDLLLVLAADVSRSIDDTKFQLQRDGYAAAISDPRVLDTIRSGRNGRIGVTFVEWSGVGAQRVVIDWTEVGDAAAAKQFGDQLIESPRSFAGRTSISGGIEFALARLANTPFNCVRRTIDVSGDGTNNDGSAAADLRDQAVAKGVTINGLVILSDNPMPWNPEHTNPPWRPRQLLPQQCRRRPRRLRHGGEKLQLVRPGHHRQDDRRGIAGARSAAMASRRPLTEHDARGGLIA